MRRFLDILVALIAGVLAAPLLALAALAVALDLGRPVVFVQQRSGLGGRPFSMIKLRSMRDSHDARGQPLPDAQRVTPLGRALRRSHVDELLGVWHLVTGDMSLVGPRPLLPCTIAALGDAGLRRGAVRPGLTGWAQVNGGALLTDAQKVALDLWYIEHRSLTLDMGILWRTLAVVLWGERVNGMALGRAHAGADPRGG